MIKDKCPMCGKEYKYDIPNTWSSCVRGAVVHCSCGERLCLTRQGVICTSKDLWTINKLKELREKENDYSKK